MERLKENILYVILFIILFLYLIYLNYKVSFGLFFDIPAMFLNTLNTSNDNFYLFFDERTRLFSTLMAAIPFNLLVDFIKPSKLLSLLSLFSASYLIAQFIGLILMFLVAKRTKRFDIAVIAFAFYCFFAMPNMVWVVREVHIALFYHFMLLQYFLSKQKLTKIDIIPIALLLLFSFESFETEILFAGILYISFYFFYTEQKNNINIKFQKVIADVSAFAALYMIIKIIKQMGNGLSSSVSQWINGSLVTLTHLFSGNIWITIFAICVLAVFLKKKNLSKKQRNIILLCQIVLSGIMLYCLTNFHPEPMIELHYYSLVLWFFAPVIIMIIAFDYTNFNIENHCKDFYSNLLKLSCITGILYGLWLANSYNIFNDYKMFLINKLKTSDETIVKITKEEQEKNYIFLNFDNCFGDFQRPIFLIDNFVKDKLLYSYTFEEERPEYCQDDENSAFYIPSSGSLVLNSAILPVKSKYWDLTPIEQNFIEHGRIENHNN